MSGDTVPNPCSLLAFGAALAGAIIGLLLTSTFAGADVYWSNLATNAIGRAATDGSGADQAFAGGAALPYGVAADGNHVYWTNTDDRTIGRANLDGSGVDQSFIAPGGFEPGDELTGVAVDGSHIFWSDHNFSSPAGSTIGRADLDGGAVNPSFVNEGAPLGVAVDAGHLYWTNVDGSNTIGRSNLDGSWIEQSFITGAHSPYGVAVDATHVYWTNGATGAIGRANLDGSEPNQALISDGGSPVGIAVDAGHVYWTNFFLKSIARANLDGTEANDEFIRAAAAPYGVAVTPGGSTGGTVITPPPTVSPPPSPLPPAEPPLRPTVPGPRAPSDRFKLAGLKLNPRTGKATMTARVPGPGQLVLSGKGIKRESKRARRAGKLALEVVPTATTAAKLKIRGWAQVEAKVTFTPSGAEPRTRALNLTLRKRE
jgi:virginiamycin B lyase